ncbi:MAG: signal peptidase I [Clostridia bacterium]|nr:signal peptidase I [Clostridia bacterium]
MKKKNEDIKTYDEEGGEIAVKPKKGRKIANIIINVILVIAILVAAFCTYVSFVSTSGNGVPSIFGYEILSIQTESMYPTLVQGDLVIDKSVSDAKDLKIDDIITYWTVIDGERVLNTHRIYEIYDGGNYLIFATKGDNNDVEDPLTVHESEVVGKYTGTRFKGLGKVFDFLQTSTGFLVIVVLPVAIFFLFHLIQFFRVLFEYQSVKNRLRYEQERGKAEDALDEEKREFEEEKKAEREKLEAELREKLKAELLGAGAATPPEEEKAEEAPAEEAPAKEAPAKTEEELRAEIEAKVRAEMEAKMAAEAAAKAEEPKDETTAE